MSQVFFPIRSLDVDASATHGAGATYRVSVGNEHWGDGDMRRVYKVQMAYDGRVAGRKSPSFPVAGDDMERVFEAMKRLKAGEGESGRGKITEAGDEPGIPATAVNAALKGQNLPE